MGSLLFKSGALAFKSGQLVFTGNPSGCSCCGSRIACFNCLSGQTLANWKFWFTGFVDNGECSGLAAFLNGTVFSGPAVGSFLCPTCCSLQMDTSSEVPCVVAGGGFLTLGCGQFGANGFHVGIESHYNSGVPTGFATFMIDGAGPYDCLTTPMTLSYSLADSGGGIGDYDIGVDYSGATAFLQGY
jgi:hypothetical protein